MPPGKELIEPGKTPKRLKTIRENFAERVFLIELPHHFISWAYHNEFECVSYLMIHFVRQVGLENTLALYGLFEDFLFWARGVGSLVVRE